MDKPVYRPPLWVFVVALAMWALWIWLWWSIVS